MNTLEHIKTRFKNRAKSKFLRQHQGLDREHEVFLDWMASEIHSVYTHLSKSSDTIEKRILQKLNPEINSRPIPVDRLAYAIPNKHKHVLNPEEDLFMIERLAENPPFEIYFSPLNSTVLTAAKIRYKIISQSFKEVVDFNETKEHPVSHLSTSLHPGTMWLGVELLDKAAFYEKLTFHLDLFDDSNSSNKYESLSLMKACCNNKELTLSTGLENILKSKNNSSRHLDSEFLWLKSIEKRIIQKYNNQFITFSSESGIHASSIPEEICAFFSEEQTKELDKKQILWLKLNFPSGFKTDDLAKLKIRLNCFPILNRKLDKSKDFTPSHFGGVEICALSNADNRRQDLSVSADYFLGLESIGSKSQTYKATIFNSFQDSGPGHYSLQHGQVEANDFKDILERVEELNNLIQNHSNRMLQVSGHNTTNAINHFKEGSSELEKVLNDIPPSFKSSGYYLHLKAINPQDMIYVKLWLTQGKAAEGVLSKGDVLSVKKTGSIKNESIRVF